MIGMNGEQIFFILKIDCWVLDVATKQDENVKGAQALHAARQRGIK